MPPAIRPSQWPESLSAILRTLQHSLSPQKVATTGILWSYSFSRFFLFAVGVLATNNMADVSLQLLKGKHLIKAPILLYMLIVSFFNENIFCNKTS